MIASLKEGSIKAKETAEDVSMIFFGLVLFFFVSHPH
jgi:hypothetical protein